MATKSTVTPHKWQTNEAALVTVGGIQRIFRVIAVTQCGRPIVAPSGRLTDFLVEDESTYDANKYQTVRVTFRYVGTFRYRFLFGWEFKPL